jgi:threonine dehydratase
MKGKYHASVGQKTRSIGHHLAKFPTGLRMLTGMFERHPSPSPARIETAFSAIDPVFLHSPFIRHEAADAALGLNLLAKVETLNPLRCFKGRGADWYLGSEPAADRPLVAASAGNFGQGLAYAARKRRRRLFIFAATGANELKLQAMRRLGAELVLEGEDFDAAKLAARTFASERGFQFVEDGAHPAIAEGAGTIGLEVTGELERRRERLDAVLVPLGNGALLTGIGAWMKARLPSCRVIGIVAEAAPAMLLSWRQARPVSTSTAATIADGIAVREPVAYALASMRDCVDDVLAVSEASMRDAMRFCHEYWGLVVEPAGAAGVAAALEHGRKFERQSLATVLCGGNLTREQMRLYLG